MTRSSLRRRRGMGTSISLREAAGPPAAVAGWWMIVEEEGVEEWMWTAGMSGLLRLTIKTVQVNSSPRRTGFDGPVKVMVMPKSGRADSSGRAVAASREGRASGRMTEGETRGWLSTPPLMESWLGLWERWIGVVFGCPKPGLTGGVKSRGVVHVIVRRGVHGFGSFSGRTRTTTSMVMTRSRARFLLTMSRCCGASL